MHTPIPLLRVPVRYLYIEVMQPVFRHLQVLSSYVLVQADQVVRILYIRHEYVPGRYTRTSIRIALEIGDAPAVSFALSLLGRVQTEKNKT